MQNETNLEAIIAEVRAYHDKAEGEERRDLLVHEIQQRPLDFSMRRNGLKLFHIDATSRRAYSQPRYYSAVTTREGAIYVEQHTSPAARLHMRMKVYA